MVVILNLQDITKWIEENPEKMESLGKKYPWLNTIDEMDNPKFLSQSVKIENIGYLP